jgi:hypothetical protein
MLKDKFGLDLQPGDYVVADSALVFQVTEPVIDDIGYGPCNGISERNTRIKLLPEYIQKITKEEAMFRILKG